MIQIDNNIRPQYLEDYVGQDDFKNNIKIYIKSAKTRDEVLDHILIYGMPGLGKTTMAHIIANEMNTNFVATSAPAIEKPGDLAAILTSLKPGDILFIDEIHRLSKNVEEILYSAMEDFYIDIVINNNTKSKSIRLDIAPFTLIGATTKMGVLSSPLRDRFGIVEKMNYYTNNELALIIKRTAEILDIEIKNNDAYKIARRSRQTPRVANNYIKRIRDYALYMDKNIVDDEVINYAFKNLKIDVNGLTKDDYLLLRTINEKFNKGPVGIDALSSILGEDIETITEVYEPFLLKLGLIKRTPRGRILTEKGINLLK